MLHCIDGCKHKTEDGLYANTLLTPSLLGKGTTYKPDNLVTVKVHSRRSVVVSCPKKSPNKKQRSKTFQAKMAHILCILALFCACFAASVAENAENDQMFKNLLLQQDSWLDKPHNKQVRCLYFTPICVFYYSAEQMCLVIVSMHVKLKFSYILRQSKTNIYCQS